MLNNIKQMINEKAAMLEAADIILDSTDLDDAIVLGEAGDDTDELTDTEGTANINEDDDEDEKDNEEKEDDDSEDDEDKGGEDLLNSKLDDEEPTEPAEPVSQPTSTPENDLLNSPIDGDSIPTPVGAQTGEPVDPTDDILSMSIDMRSNTLNDTLPVPPSNAVDSIMSTSISNNMRIDSGFGGSSVDDPLMNTPIDGSPSDTIMNTPIGDKPDEISEDDDLAVDSDLSSTMDAAASAATGGFGESAGITESLNNLQSNMVALHSIFSEAISIGGDDKNDDSDSGGDVPADEKSDDTSDSDKEDENTVTSAVRDKVSEADTDSFTTDTGSEGPSAADAKALFQKLSTITKNVEDAKSALMNLTSGK